MKEISERIVKLEDTIRSIEQTVNSIVSSVANIRGIINRKLYSGKMKEETPSWLESNLGFFGITKDKKDEVLGS